MRVWRDRRLAYGEGKVGRHRTRVELESDMGRAFEGSGSVGGSGSAP